MESLKVGDRRVLERHDFPSLFRALSAKGYSVVGPTVRDGAIVYDHLSGVDDLPIGWTDVQSGGKYRLERRKDEALFGYSVGPFSWKKYLYPSRERLWTARRDGDSFTVTPEPTDGPPLAFFGMRACELAGVAVQDHVFMGGPAVDPGYAARRVRVLRVAIQCGQAGGTCFCVSMGTGPAVRSGAADIILTEILEPERHYFVVEVGSGDGAAVLADVPLKALAADDPTKAAAVVSRAVSSMGRKMDTEGIHDLLLKNLEHPRWDVVAKRCLLCTNCTMVCPTCFCSNQEEMPNLSVDTVERWRRWDSCFNLGLTEMHGQAVRKSGLSRYRQWLTHKLATWYDQFGTSGCVGCGRCITWCPVGIDLTEEVAAIRMVPAVVATSEVKK
jgi:ferredoxin